MSCSCLSSMNKGGEAVRWGDVLNSLDELKNGFLDPTRAVRVG